MRGRREHGGRANPEGKPNEQAHIHRCAPRTSSCRPLKKKEPSFGALGPTPVPVSMHSAQYYAYKRACRDPFSSSHARHCASLVPSRAARALSVVNICTAYPRRASAKAKAPALRPLWRLQGPLKTTGPTRFLRPWPRTGTHDRGTSHHAHQPPQLPTSHFPLPTFSVSHFPFSHGHLEHHDSTQ